MKSTGFRSALLFSLAMLLAGCSSPEAQKKRHFDRGNKYAAEKRDDFAVIEYANAVRIDPKFGEARWKLAQAYERMNNIQAAFPEYIRAADALPNNREAQIKATELLILGSRFDDANARATALLTKDPKDVDARLLRANALAGLKDPEGAIAEAQEALKVQPTEARAHLALGEIRMKSGAVAQAEAAFKEALALQPSSVAAHLSYANFLWSTGRAAEAERELKQSVALEPRNVIANRMLATLYSSTNRLADAEAPLKIVAETAGIPAARFELAQYYVTARRYDDARKLLTTLAADNSSFARAEAMLASLDYDSGHTKEAHARLDKLLTRVPNDSPALALNAQWLAKENNLDEALARAKASVAADPQSATASYVLGMVHALRRENREAIQAYREVLRLNPRVVAAQVELSRLTLATGDPGSARRYAEEAKQRAPGEVNPRLALVRSLLTQGDLEKASSEVSALLRDQPNLAAVHALNGTLNAMRKNNAGAKSSYMRALELAPGNFEALAGLTALDLNAKQTESAINRVETELAKQPNSLELLTLASRVYQQVGQKARAEQMLRRLVSANPRFLTGYAMLADFYMRERRLDDARAEFESIVKRDPRAVGPRTMIGVILEAQGKREEAKRSYQSTVADLGSAPIAANNLAYMYAEEGSNLDTALQLASSAKKEVPDSSNIDDTLGWVYYKKDLLTLAIPYLEESVKKTPDSADRLYHLGMAYAKNKDNAKARVALERALKINPSFAGSATARQTLQTLAP